MVTFWDEATEPDLKLFLLIISFFLRQLTKQQLKRSENDNEDGAVPISLDDQTTVQPVVVVRLNRRTMLSSPPDGIDDF